MTPCEKLGYRIGDKFRVSGFYAFACNSIIELERDDGSEWPLFKLISGFCKYNNAKGGKAGAYCDLNYVQKIEEKEMTHQKKPHRHAEMMKAYADDVSLCVFIKCNELIHWEVSRHPSFDPRHEYFPCLPKHKEACLHWLNGGLIECNSKFTNGWEDCADYNECFWKLSCGMMREDANYRIKPKKEKRWISYNTKTLQVYNCEQNHTPAEGFQVIEIEAEI